MDKIALARLLDADGWPAEHPASRRERRARPDRAWRAPKARRPAPPPVADLAHEAAAPNSASGLVLSATLDATSEERDWIANHLGPFAGDFSENQLLTAVLRRVKGGKEANVYCCAAHSSSGLDLIAAKLYRPRLLRNLRNDARYRQGRPVLGPGGARDRRLHKAIAQKSHAGLEANEASWLEYEYQTMLRLHQAGADVPRPLKHDTNVILMEYVGDDGMPAPLLSQVTLDRSEAPDLFARLLHNVELMLSAQVVHGDLSAYNVLYWEGEPRIIDFPQVVDPRQNREAFAIFQRDIERLCQYFARHGVASQPNRLARDLWRKHVRRNGAGD